LVATPEEEEILRTVEPEDVDSGCPHERCMEGTRHDILSQINAWIDDREAPNILWLKGYPGVGKSAIASTLVSQLRASNRLGSSFFFQRAKASVMTTRVLWRKIAVDLARQYPSMRRAIIAKLQTKKEDFTTQSIGDLFRMLIQEPLLKSDGNQTEGLSVVLIDALDECGGLEGMNSRDREQLVQTLRLWPNVPKKFKLIVTSRNETDIDDAFLEMPHYPIGVPSSGAVVLSDIHYFLQVRLHSIATRYRKSLPSGWPESSVIDELTRKAQGLFIWAETVVKFISKGIPQTRLRQILDGQETGDLSDLYSLILSISFPDPDSEIIDLFHSVVGSVIMARKPLSAPSIAQLLSIDEMKVANICTRLQSVLDSRRLLQFNHQSFVDFILDKAKNRSSFFIDRDHANREISISCLRTMKKELRFNICELQSSYIPNEEIVDLDLRIERRVPQELFYSCYYWMDHLSQTKYDDELSKKLEVFIENLFLYWLEVLSVTKGVGLAREMLRKLTDWMKVMFNSVVLIHEKKSDSLPGERTG
jgi:hypothetical protein